MRLPAILLVLPILAFNLAFSGFLPPAYQSASFDAALPSWLPVVENALRLAVFGVMLVLPLGRNRTGWIVFLAGLLVYAASWTALILAPASPWSMSLTGFTAPAWTPAFWLAGIGFIACTGHPLARRVYWIAVPAFLAAHIGHAALVWTRL